MQARGATLRVICGCIITAILSACTPSDNETQRADVLVIGVEAMPENRDPRYYLDAYSDRVNKLLYRGLFKPTLSGSVEPDLASDYQFFGASSGETFLDIGLVKDAVFHNGSPVEIEDVLFTYQSVLRSKDSPRKAGLTAVRAVTTITNGNDTKLRFVLEREFAPILPALIMGIVPRGSTRDLAKIPVGAGPFRMASARNNLMVLERYPKNLEGKFNRVELRVIKNETARALALENGEIDLVQNALPPQDLTRFKEMDGFAVDQSDGSNVSYVGFNCEDPILKNPMVRAAISHAIDREALIQTLMYGTAKPSGSVLPLNNWAFSDTVTADAYDLQRAEELLDQAGFPRKEGLRFKLEYKTSTNKLRLRIAEAIAASLGQVGIEVKIVSLDFGTFFEHVRRGAFQMYTLTWTGLTEPDILYSAFHSDSVPPSGANRGRFKDSEIDRLTSAARHTMNAERRSELYEQAQKRLDELKPYAVLWNHDAILVRKSDKVQRFSPYPDGNFLFVEDLVLQ